MAEAQTPVGGRLVVVDDEPVILKLLTQVFQGEPWELVPCATGREAASAIEDGVDVLLTDKNLPDVGGLELVRLARERQPDSECIIITGYASLDTALEAMQLDVFDYIVKPPKNVFDVQRKVRQAFEKIAVVRENRRLLRTLKAKNAALEQTLSELREVQDELIQSEKLAGIGTLAAGIAHEISSPLFGVMGLAEAIVDEEDVATAHSHAREIVEYSRSIKDIVVQLSGYSRTAESEYLTTVDLQQVVRDAALLVTRSTSCREGWLDVQVPSGLYINAKTGEIQQVFVNLIKNAVEALLDHRGEDDAAQVCIEAGADDKGVWATVSDNGPGIPEEHRSAIFDPFYTTKPPGRGTGLGLNIVYRIVTKYRGTITMSSVIGEGTTFTMRFASDAG